MPKQVFDAQGRLFYHYVKLAGWDQKRADALILKRWKATHWNALTQPEKRAAINIMKSYVAKAERAKSAKLRQMIMAYVAKNGQTLEWLHDMMEAWGAGRSLRALNYTATIEVWNAVRSCFRVDEPQPNNERSR